MNAQFSFSGSRQSCDSRKPHAPHVTGSYVNGRGSRRSEFCVGLAGPGIKIVRTHALSGTPGDSSEFAGHVEHYTPLLERAPISATWVFGGENPFISLKRRLVVAGVEVLDPGAASAHHGWRIVVFVGCSSQSWAEGCEIWGVPATAEAVAERMVMGRPVVQPSYHEHCRIFGERSPYGDLCRTERGLWIASGPNGEGVFVPED